jgi:FkbM family methyltransferase
MFLRKIFKTLLSSCGYSIVTSNVIGTLHTTIKAYVDTETPVIFDVGAHYGESVTDYRCMLPHSTIYSFEPDSQSFSRLKQNTAGLKDVYCFQQALSDNSGQADLYINSSSATNSLLPISDTATALWGEAVRTSSSTERVTTATLDSFCVSQNVDRINILKIDVQGAEMSVLKGATDMFSREKVDVVICEIITSPTYTGQNTLKEYLEFVENSGLVLVDILNPVRKKNRLLQIDAIFVRSCLVYR